MAIYVEYIQDTGEIIGVGNCSPSFIDIQSPCCGGAILDIPPTHYDTIPGAIPEAPDKQIAIYPDVNPETQYINTATEELTDRPQNNATISSTSVTANGTDEAIITGISDPSTVTITSASTEQISETCTDGQVEFSATEPGEYNIRLVPEFPEQEKIFTVTAT